MTTTRTIGTHIEQLAADYLNERGLLCLHRNFRCLLGEIDLICRHNDAVVFVEVRFRRHVQYGSAAESVGVAKQYKIKRTARYFLRQQSTFAHFPCRFDVIAVTLKGEKPDIDWIQGAFY